MASGTVIIVGGGVSGLATAYFLSKLGIQSTLIEKSERLGGLIATGFVEGCRLEAGPDSYLAAKPAVTELAEELGDLKNQIIGSNDEQRRIFVVRRGELVAMPKGMAMIAPGAWTPALRSPLFSAKTKLRFLTETFTRPRQRSGDISVAELVRDHFGEEVVQYAAEPLLSGVYGGDAAGLSAESVLPRFLAYERRYGSLIQGVRRERNSTSAGSLFLSFRDGMQSLTDALAKAIAGSSDIRHAEAESVERTAHAWRVRANGAWIEAAQLVLACPAHACARLLASSAATLASELAAIPYSSALGATLVYERARVAHPLNGFGFLVPRAERQTISAATWIGNKFPFRIPAHLAAIRAFIVDPEASRLLNASEEAILQLVSADFQRLMNIRSAPLFASVHRWPASMPQYVVGHRQRCLRIAGLLQQFQFLHLTGNAYEGVGIPDCVRLAKETANHVRKSASDS